MTQAHGIRGGLKVHSYTQPKDKILKYSPWKIKRHGQWETFIVKSSQLANGPMVIVYTDACTTRNEAETFIRCDIAIERSELPALAEHEYYWHDLIGLTVTNSQGKTLGVIQSLMETGANDVMVIQGEKEILIPYRPGHVILNIDLTHKHMLVDWDPDF